MKAEFIFMLTRNDKTVADAVERLPEVIAAGVSHVGFKDIGVPQSDLKRLAKEIKSQNGTLYLEVVSLDRDSEARSAALALALGVDVLMGGTRPAVVTPVIAGSKIRYYPFAGSVVGHPSVLTGTIGSIVDSALALTEYDGVHGIDLLAYRFAGRTPALISAVCHAISPKPVVVAGSLDSAERLAIAIRGGASGFTVGTAAWDGRFPSDAPGLTAQLLSIRRTVEATDGSRALTDAR